MSDIFWDHFVGDCIEYKDGSIDAVYVNEASGDVELKPATAKQIEAYNRHKEWVAAGCPDVWTSLDELLR
jgi:hypothetical protein